MEGTAQRFLVVDLGGTHIRTAVADQDGRLTGRLDEPTPEGGPKDVIVRIVEMMHGSLSQAGVTMDAISRIVLAVPGPLDHETGVVYSPPNIPGWHDVPLREELETALQRPVQLENDADAAALGEFRFGAARGTRTAVYITISTGIGGGVVSGGRLLRGRSGMANEIGHMTIDRNGPICGCGNVGCLEASGSGTAIARQFRAAAAEGRESSVQSAEPNAAEIAAAAEAGDAVALEVFLNAAEAIGTGVANVINLFNPEMVVLGGGVSQIGEPLFKIVRRVVHRRALPSNARGVLIVPAQLGKDVGLIGALAAGLAEEREQAGAP